MEITAAYKFEIFMGSKVTWPLSRSEAELRLFCLFLCKQTFDMKRILNTTY